MEPGECCPLCREAGPDPGLRRQDAAAWGKACVFHLYLFPGGERGKRKPFPGKARGLSRLQVLSTEAEKEALGLAGCDGRPDFLEDPAPGLVQTLRLWPHRLRGEGHFAAVLAREGRFPLGQQARGALYGSLQGAEKASGVRGKNSRTRGKDSAEKDLGLLVDFAEELLGQGSLEKFAAALGVDESFYFVN